jgi:hypothetical protein
MNDGLALPLRLTAIALLLRPMGPWYVRPAILALACGALLSRRAMLSRVTWGVLAALVAMRIASDWPLADNHIYLLGYWCLAIALALGGEQPADILAASGRWLLGLAFVLAVLWKGALASDFVDGRFFRVTLMTDPRFHEASMLIAGLTPTEVESNARALVAMPEGAEPVDPPSLVEPARLRVFATISTWGILVLESVVAIAMLAPLPATAWANALRHGSVLGFCLVTYAMAPVAGFGWLLLVMGLAMSPGRRLVVASLYVTAFLLVLFYSEVPWPGLLLDLVRGSSA